jgi:hypothetical protein
MITRCPRCNTLKSDVEQSTLDQLPPYALLSVPIDLHIRHGQWLLHRSFLDTMHKCVTSGCSFEGLADMVVNTMTAHDCR